ncbi:MAG: hypothetical protein ACE5IJ_08900 [Thermoplasmata archaeon]
MARVSWLSREVWDGWDWIFGIGFVLLLSTVGLWSFHVLFVLPLIAGVTLIGISVYHAEKRYRVLKRQGRPRGGERDG